MENTYLPVIFSSRLREILMKINDDISRYIINLEENEDFYFLFSFFDLTEEDSSVSFITGNKYNELPKERGNSDLVWSTSARSEIRLGRFINKVAPFFKPVEIERWVNSFKAEFKNAIKKIKFDVIEGKDIIKFYNGKRYGRGNGSLNKSCMRHDQCAEWMDLYSMNPDKIKMVILIENREHINGRALLWKLDDPADTWLMDRIYVREDSDAILFKKFAEKNKWLYKPAQTFDCINVVKDGKETFLPMRVYIRGDYTYFPYIDTLLYYDQKEKYLTNCDKDYETVPSVIKLRETNGGHSGNENYVFDVLNKEYIKAEDSIFCYYGDGYTHKNSAFFIKELDEYILPTKLRYSKFHKRFLNSESSVFSKNLNSFMLMSDVHLVHLTKDANESDYFLKSNLCKSHARVGNKYYIMDLLAELEGRYFFKDELESALDKKKKEREIVNDIIENSPIIIDYMGLAKKRRIKNFFGFNEVNLNYGDH